MIILSKNILRISTFLFLYSLLLSGCDKREASEQEKNALAPPLTNDNNSVRVFNQLPNFELSDQKGNELNSLSLYGKVWIANFIFTECKNTCPLQTASMKQLQTRLKAQGSWEDIRMVSFSVDPEADTPTILSKYIKQKELDDSQWYFLTGNRDLIWNLIKKGFMLPVDTDPKNTNMPILHSSQFVLVDWEGSIRGYYNSLDDQDVNKLERDLKQVVLERTLPPETNPTWVPERRQAQLEAAKNFKIFNNFSFNDEIKDSGITFRHKIVDDAAKDYKAVHYDHGNGLAVADVDSDGLYDIYFTSQSGSNELWRNLGAGKFENITDSAGLNIDDRIGVAASFADIDNDGDPDLYTTNVRVGNQLFENDGNGHFKNITQTSGTGVKAHSSGAVFFDYDRDGLLDLFVNNIGVYTTDTVSNVSFYSKRAQHVTDYKYFVGFKDGFAGHLKPERAETSILFRNMGNNRFEDVSKRVELVDKSWNGDATVIDGNDDGWPDLYLLSMQGNDEYYENIKGAKFVRKSRELFPKTPWGSMGAKLFDFDNDGDMDLYVTDMHSDMSEKILGAKEKQKMETRYPETFLQSGGNSIFGNAFYRKENDGSYTEISDEIGAENYWPWGLSAGDLNSDGYEDVFIASSMNYPFRYSINSLLLNDEGRGFLDSEYVLGVEPRKYGASSAPWFALDCSGTDAGDPVCGTNKGQLVTWGALGSRSSIIFDLDQDGDQDIVTLEFNQAPMVLMSNLSEQKKINFLKIKLIGKKSNRDGIGATVKVYSGNDVYTKVQDGKSGYLSQSILPLYFGLGEKNTIDKIEVTWPSGTKQVIDNKLKTSKLLEITES